MAKTGPKLYFVASFGLETRIICYLKPQIRATSEILIPSYYLDHGKWCERRATKMKINGLVSLSTPRQEAFAKAVQDTCAKGEGPLMPPESNLN